MVTEPKVFGDVAPCVDAIIARLGKNIHLGLPLGLGKANRLANGLYQRALDDKSITLQITTALSLTRPQASQPLEKRFLDPFVERLWDRVPELHYARDLQRGRLPENVRVSEFFFKAGDNLDNASQQQNFICSNYTHAVRDLLARGINVVGQMVAPHPEQGGLLSLSCNPDLSLDLIPRLREEARDGHPVVVVGEVNPELPYMAGHAELPTATFDLLLEGPTFNYDLFPVPATPIAPAEHLIGFYASTLIRDGGTLQLGIGALGSAVVYSTLLRHQRNHLYRAMLERLDVSGRFPVALGVGGAAPFETGLYGCSEMLVDGFIDLFEAGVLKREVFDDLALQRLLNQGDVVPRPSLALLDRLLQVGVIESPLRARDLQWLQRFGIFRDSVELKGGRLVLGDTTVTPDLDDPAARQTIADNALGESLAGGVLAHGGFFIGPQKFYQSLKTLDPVQRRKFSMTSVNFINDLYDHRLGSQSLKVAQRRHGRFINSAMMQTLTGATVSDGLEDGRVISGVGGQYNFVAMAHELPEARSILTLRSTRKSGGKTVSNIVFSYGNTTVPRHLRDIVVTEYGIADLRGKSDQEVCQALIQIADSRFQEGLLRQAKKVGKVGKNWKIPRAYCENRPQKLNALVAEMQDEHGVFPAFPFGCSFTDDELRLTDALQELKRAGTSTAGKLVLLAGTLRKREVPDSWMPLLLRMGLAAPSGWRHELQRRLLLQGLVRTERKKGRSPGPNSRQSSGQSSGPAEGQR